MTKCDYCGESAVWTLYHRSGNESHICDNCERPDDIRDISKVGLEFKSDNWLFVTSEENKNG